MRVFVSSSFEDLQEHRAAAIRVLRQLGHDVVAMEDMTAGSVAPLQKVLEMVDRCEAYIGIFAWRYGYVPKGVAPAAPPLLPPGVAVAGAAPDETSITHHEYLRALERSMPVLAFLLDETYPWPPRLIDGFDASLPNAPSNTDSIRGLRAALQKERVVSWFTTPSDLEARVSAAITTVGLTSQLNLQDTTALDPAAGAAGDSSAELGIRRAIAGAGERQRALKIDVRSPWWSTRLYLIAALAERLTNVRRILIIESPKPAAAAAQGQPSAKAAADNAETFIGQISTTAVLATIGSRIPAIATFEQWLRARPIAFDVLEHEISELLDGWGQAFGDVRPAHQHEEAARIVVSPDLLRRWFGDAMLREPVRIADLQRASVVDLLRLLDYPGDFVPVETSYQPSGSTPSKRITVMDKAALNANLAHTYLNELKDRARIS